MKLAAFFTYLISFSLTSETILHYQGNLPSCGLHGSTWERIYDCSDRLGILICGDIPERELSGKKIPPQERAERAKQDCQAKNTQAPFQLRHFPKRYKDAWTPQTKNKIPIYNPEGFSLVTINTNKEFFWLDHTQGLVWTPLLENGRRDFHQYEDRFACSGANRFPSKKELETALENGLLEILGLDKSDHHVWLLDTSGNSHANSTRALSLANFKYMSSNQIDKLASVLCVQEDSASYIHYNEAVGREKLWINLLIGVQDE